MNNWHVITGGPSSGKTTLLAELAKRGYKTVPEAARTVIDEGLAAGFNLHQIRKDDYAFQKKVMQLKIEIEKKLNPLEITFFDRGLHDTIAYLQASGNFIEEWIWEAVRSSQYQTVLLLDPLLSFTEDYARTENPAEAARLHELLFTTYAGAGLKPINVPALPMKERTDFVLQHVE